MGVVGPRPSSQKPPFSGCTLDAGGNGVDGDNVRYLSDHCCWRDIQIGHCLGGSDYDLRGYKSQTNNIRCIQSYVLQHTQYTVYRG